MSTRSLFHGKLQESARALSAELLMHRSIVLVACLALVPFAHSAVADAPGECADAVSVTWDEDACGSVAAVSVHGDAWSTAPACGTPSAPVGCVAVSAFGDAATESGDRACGAEPHDAQLAGYGCVAASGTGNASNRAGDDACGHASIGYTAGCVAVSGTGNASNDAGSGACGWGQATVVTGCVAASGTGNATNRAGDDACGVTHSPAVATGCVAVSGTGNAWNDAGTRACGDRDSDSDGGGAALGCVSASGTGDAVTRAGDASCGQGGGTEGKLGVVGRSVGAGCVAVSGFGDASVDAPPESCGVNTIVGVGYGCVEASLRGLLP